VKGRKDTVWPKSEMLALLSWNRFCDSCICVMLRNLCQ